MRSGLYVIPDYVADALDKHVATFRTQFPDATDDDAENVRGQLLDAFLTYGTIPEFTVQRTDADAA